MASMKQYSDSYVKSKFLSVFPELVKELTELPDDGLMNDDIKDSIQRHKNIMEAVFDHNVKKGKCNRGLMVIGSLCHLVKDITPEQERKALILGWCIEWLHAFFLAADDVMVEARICGGRFRREKLGLMAISFLFKEAIYFIVKRYFKTEPYYVHIIEIFHEITYKTEVGQCLDMKTSPMSGTVDLSTFTIERYQSIVKYKTAFYSFYLPVALAMYMAGIVDDPAHQASRNILLPTGEYFQVQDDYIDCFGDPSVTGKIGTDIEECKCGWLVVQALKRVTPEQRETLKENYGKDNTECVKRVKELYNQLNLQQVYCDYEEQSYKLLMASLDSQLECTPLPRELFIEFADRIYKRKK